MSYSKLSSYLFSRIANYLRAKERSISFERTEDQVKRDVYAMNKYKRQAASAVEEMEKKVAKRKLTKKMVSSIFGKDEKLFLEFVYDRYNYNEWEDILIKFVRTGIVDDLYFHIIYIVHEMHLKYPRWILENVFV